MRSDKKARFIGLVLAMLFCFGVLNVPSDSHTASAAQNTYIEPPIRVGMFIAHSYFDARPFSSPNTSATGFEFGTSSEYSFNSLFESELNNIIILPQVNANVNISSRSCTPAPNGNIGAYSAVIGSHSTAAEAFEAAKRLDNAFVAVVKGGFEVRAYASNTAEQAAAASENRPVHAPVAGGITVLDGNSGKILFTFEDTTRNFALRARNGGTVSFPTANGNFSYYGFFEYRISDGKLWMANCLGLETYTKCVMSIEIGTNYSIENRRAFSVLIRTFAAVGKHGGGYDVCNTTCCQVYYGTHRMNEVNNELTDSTRGLVCTYNGNPISTYYHVSNGGSTCSSLAAWGSRDLPYLHSVFLEENENAVVWKYEYTQQQFYDFMKSRRKFYSLRDDNIKLEILGTDPYGSEFITHLQVSDESGAVVNLTSAEGVRGAFGYNSGNFRFEYSTDLEVLKADGTVEKQNITGVLTADGYKKFDDFDKSYANGSQPIGADKITINGEGSGHGVGYSVRGAEQLAKKGYDYKYILGFFYQGTVLKILS